MTCPCCSTPLHRVGKWWTCDSCGHRVHDISEKENHAYQRGFRNHRGLEGDIEHERINIPKFVENRWPIYSKRIDFLEKVLPCGGTMWDFGCGAGITLLNFGSKFRGVGTEVDPFCIDAMVRLGIRHTMGDPVDQDVVMAWHSIEHTYDVVDTMARLMRALAPGGLLIVEVPVDRYRYGDGFIGHRHEFSVGSFENLIGRSGLEGKFRDGFQPPSRLFWGGKK
jgi:hypothetical protein